jgi:CubicO group peptidase (beta-lactamase class C family)
MFFESHLPSGCFKSSLPIPPHFSGILAVKQNDQIIFQAEYGLKNERKSPQNSAKLIFCIGSLTKMFTACAILLLEEKKQLHTSDSIAPFFPECPQAKKITIHHLLTHTAGMANYTDCEEFWALRTEPISPTELIERFTNKPLLFSPGSQYAYSNSGYVLLGSVIEQVSGLSYGAFLSRYIFTSLGMHSTQYGLPIGKAVVEGYTLTEQKEKMRAPFLHSSFAYAAGGIYSTLEDLLLWDQQLFTFQLLSSPSVNKMHQRYCFTNAEQSMGYGYGLNIEFLSDHGQFIKHIWHRGGTDGFSCLYSRYLEINTTLVILTNNDQLKDEIRHIEKELVFPVAFDPLPCQS